MSTTNTTHPSKAEVIRQYLFDSFMAEKSGDSGYQDAVKIGRALGFTARSVAAVMRCDKLGFRPDWVEWEETWLDGEHRVPIRYRISREGIREGLAALTTKED
jgi:hypothetical protein